MDKNTRILLIQSNLRFDEEFSIKCLKLLFEHQTADEQNADVAIHQNGVGFNSADAPVLSAYMKGIEAGYAVFTGYLHDMQQRLHKYAAQLETLLPHNEFE